MDLGASPSLRWWGKERGTLPDAEPAPWTVVGAGGTVASSGVNIAATAAANYYRRAVSPTDPDPAPARTTDRIELQVRFRGLTRTPAWAAGSPHGAFIDDGERFCGIAIGDALQVIDQTGAVLATPVASLAWLAWTEYRIVKRGTTYWQVYVGGKLVWTAPYESLPASTATQPTLAFGCLDPGGTGEGIWSSVEDGVDLPLAPLWKVDRIRNAMPAYLQQRWNLRWTALAAALVGIHQGAQDEIAETFDDFTAAMQAVQIGPIDGSALPGSGWTIEGDSGDLSIVRDRLVFEAGDALLGARYDLAIPAKPNVAYTVRATVQLEQVLALDPARRLGPYLRIDTGTDLRITAQLLRDPVNPESVGWILTDGDLPSEGASAGGVGTVRWSVDPTQPHRVEVWVLGIPDGDEELGPPDSDPPAGHVILIVDGYVADYAPRARFSRAASTTTPFVEIGRDGSPFVQCALSVEDVRGAVFVADNHFRPWFNQHIAEMLVFASGCERNDELSVLLWNLDAVLDLRGTTQGASNEIRRLACDDNARLIREDETADWYLDVTWPDITPVYEDTDSLIAHEVFEIAPHAPNFTIADLLTLIRTYILPIRTVEMAADVLVATVLSSDATTTSEETYFDVVDPAWFAAGDVVQLRQETTGTLLELTYSADDGLSAVDAHNFGGGPAGSLVQSGTVIANDWRWWGGSAVASQSAPHGAGYLVIRAASMPTMAVGFAIGGWLVWDAGGFGTVVLAASQSPATTGGLRISRDSSNRVIGEAFSAVGASVGSVTSAALTWSDDEHHHVALSYDPAATGAELALYLDGAAAGTAAASGAADVASGGLAFGGDWSAATPWPADSTDWIALTRPLASGEVAALVAGARQAAPRDDADVWAAFLPAAYSALEATHTGTPSRPEYAEVAVEDERCSAAWWTRVDAGQAEIDGAVVLAERSADKLANVGAGHTATIVGTDGGETGRAWIYGIQNGTGLALREQLDLDGLTPVVGAILWAASGLHGVELETDQPGDVTVTDTTSATALYTVTTGDTTAGVHVFVPALPAGQVVAALDYSGAGTPKTVVFGSREGDAFAGEAVTLATGSTDSVERYDTIRVVGAAYLAAASTLTVHAVLTDPTGTLSLVSSDAGDTMNGWVFAVDTAGVGRAIPITLDGLTPVAVGSVWRILGALLDEAPAGTISVSTAGGVATLDHGSFTGAAWAFVERSGPADGVGRATLSTVPSSTRLVMAFGRLEGVAVADLFELVGSDEIVGAQNMEVLVGVATGGLHAGEWATLTGRAFAFVGVRATAVGVGDIGTAGLGWAATVEVPELVVELDDLEPVDATSGTLSLTGSAHDYESAAITSIVGATMHFEPLAGTYVTGDTMRQQRE